MNFELDEDVVLLRDNVREFCRQEIVPHAAQWDEAGDLPDSIRSALGGMGLLGLRLSESDGGAGLSMVATSALLEELAAADAAVATLVAVHAVLGLPALAKSSDASQLPGLVDGAAWVGWADDPSLTAKADGDAVVLEGRADFVIGATESSPVVMLVDGDAGGLFRLPASSEAVAVEALGLRAAPIVERSLDGVRLPAAARLGGPQQAHRARVEGRIALAAIAVGQGGAALRAARDYALEREQFGRPIAKFQAIQWKIANMATQLDASRLLTLKAAALVDGGQDADAAAARAKLKAGQAAVQAASEALQVHGGYGYTTEFPVERALRNARVLDAMLGGSRALRGVAAQSIVARYAE